MKTPDEIKKGLEYCGNEPYCDGNCEYYEDADSSGCQLSNDALAYIQQLESSYNQVSKALYGKENATLEELLQADSQLKSRLAQVERERDALIKHVQGKFHACKHADGFPNEGLCGSCKHTFHAKRESAENWQWRGVCDGNTKEELT